MTAGAGPDVPASTAPTDARVGTRRPWCAPLALISAVLLVAAVTTLAPVLVSSPAHACSCASPSPAADLVGSRDVAFVGTAGPGRELEPGVLVHDVTVEQAVKGDLPPVVQVAAVMFEASCGTSVPTGVPMGFVPSSFGPTGRTDEWWVDLCSGLIAPGELRAVVAARLPAATGTGPVSALVIARAGPADAVVVAADGRPAGWVELPPVDGFVDLLGASVCPGGAMAALLLARYDELGQQTSTAVHLLDIVTLELTDTPTIVGDPVVFGPWSIGGTACLDDVGTTMAIVDRDGDGTPSELQRLGTDGLTVERLDGSAAAIEGTDLVEVVDGTVVRRDLAIEGSTSTPLFSLGAGVVPLDLDAFGDEVVVTRRDVDGTVLVERYTTDGTMVGSWRVADVESAHVSVTDAGALLWDGYTGRQQWLRADGDVVNVPGNGGGALLGDGVLTWSYEGSARRILQDGTDDPAWSFLSGPSIRFAVPLVASVSVDPTSPAAGALPVVDRPGRILSADDAAPASVATPTSTPPTTGSTAGATTQTSVGAAAVESSSDDLAGDSSATGTVVAVLLAVVLAAGAALLLIGRTRRARAVGGTVVDQ